MEKDKRSHTKRVRMRNFKKNHYQKVSQNSNTNSPIEIGLIDVADSSDERFSCRSLEWSRRSNLDDDEELDSNAEQIGGDFEILQKMPISGGSGHFQFNSEKNWENDDDDDDTKKLSDKSEASEYFTLNLVLLNAGLQTIPFYKRMDYAGIFNKTDIMLMNNEAENAEIKYQEILKEYVENDNKKNKKPLSGGSKKRNSSAKSTKSIKSDKSGALAPPPPSVVNEELPNIQNDAKDTELDELLSLTSNVAKVNLKDDENPTDNNIVKPENPDGNADDVKTEEQTEQLKNVDEIGNKEDIQQWLDDILE